MLSFLLALNLIFNQVDESSTKEMKYIHIGNKEICKEYTNEQSLVLKYEIEMPTKDNKGDCLYVEDDSKFINIDKYSTFIDDFNYVVVILVDNLKFKCNSQYNQLHIKGKKNKISATFDLNIRKVKFENLDVHLTNVPDTMTFKNSGMIADSTDTKVSEITFEFDKNEDNFVFPDSLTSYKYNFIGVGNDISVSIKTKITINTDSSKFYANNIRLSFQDYTDKLKLYTFEINNADLILGENVNVDHLTKRQQNDLMITSPDTFKNVRILEIYIQKNDFQLGSLILGTYINFPEYTTIGANVAGTGQIILPKISTLRFHGVLDQKNVLIDNQEYLMFNPNSKTCSNILYANEENILLNKLGSKNVIHLKLNTNLANPTISNVFNNNFILDIGSYNINNINELELVSLYYESENSILIPETIKSTVQKTGSTIKITVNSQDPIELKELQIENNGVINIIKSSSIDDVANCEVIVEDLYSIIKAFEIDEKIKLTINNVLSTTLETIPGQVVLSKGFYIFIEGKTVTFKKVSQGSIDAEIEYDLSQLPLDGSITFISELETEIKLTNTNYFNAEKIKIIIKDGKFSFGEGVFFIEQNIDFPNYIERSDKNYRDSIIYMDNENAKMIQAQVDRSNKDCYSIESGSYNTIYMIGMKLALQDQNVNIQDFYYDGNSPFFGENAKLTVNNFYFRRKASGFYEDLVIPEGMSITDSIHIQYDRTIIENILKLKDSVEATHLFVLPKYYKVEYQVLDEYINMKDIYDNIIKFYHYKIHFEYFSPQEDINIKIVDKTTVDNAQIKSSYKTNKNTEATPFIINIKGDFKKDIKVVFDITGMTKKIFDGPIEVSIPQGTSIKTIIKKDDEEINEDEIPEYFEIKVTNEKPPQNDPNDPNNPNEPNEPNEPNDPPKGDTPKPKKFPVGGIIGIVIGCIIVIAVVVVVIFVLKKKKADKSNDEQSELEDSHNI